MASTRQSRSEAKRAELLRIATELFLAKGYEAVSVDQIVARAGGTKSNVYKHFGDKAGLFTAVVEELSRRTAPAFAGLPADAKPEEALRQAGRRFLAELLTPRSIRQHRLVIAESARFPAIGKRWFKAGPEQARAALAAWFQGQQKAGRLRGPAPQRQAALFLDMLGGDQLLRQLITGATPPATREINKLVDEAVGVFLHGTPGSRKG